MQNQLTCEQVSALLSFFVEDKLSKKLSEYVSIHLESCPECMKKYIELKTMLKKYIDIKNREIENPYLTKQYENFKLNLSAYIDNELNPNENIKIKKIAISNPLARQDLEEIYSFKKLLHNAFQKTKTDIRNDYSKSIINMLKQQPTKKHTINPFLKLNAIFFMILVFIITGIISLLYF